MDKEKLVDNHFYLTKDIDMILKLTSKALAKTQSDIVRDALRDYFKKLKRNKLL